MKSLRVAALLRVSTTRVEQEESPAAQLAYIREEIRRHGAGEHWVDTGLVYQDELTGALVLERPDVQRALADAQAGRYDLLAMKSISRMGRDTLGLLAFKRHLDDLDVELVALQDGYRSRRDLELIFLVHADRAQHGRLEISRNVRTNLRQKARQGKWLAGTVPFGYRRCNRHQLELHPETAPLARLIFDLRLQGRGSSAIARHLNQLGVPAPAWWYFRDLRPRWTALAATDERWAARLADRERRFARPPEWSPRSVLVILRNTAYRGELLYHRVWFRHRLGGRVTRERRPEAEWVRIPCPPLLAPEQWQQAQGTSRAGPAPRRAASPYLLTGLLVCGRCGGTVSGGGAAARGAFYRYYQCRNRRERRSCDAPRLRAEPLEAALVAHLRARLVALRAPGAPPGGPPGAPPWGLSWGPPGGLPGAVSPEGAGASGYRRQLRERLADLAEERRYYRSEHRRGRVGEAELDAELARIAGQEEALRLELARLNPATPPEEGVASNAARQVARLAGELPEPSALRRLLALALERAVLAADGGIDLHWRFALPPP